MTLIIYFFNFYSVFIVKFAAKMPLSRFEKRKLLNLFEPSSKIPKTSFETLASSLGLDQTASSNYTHTQDNSFSIVQPNELLQHMIKQEVTGEDIETNEHETSEFNETSAPNDTFQESFVVIPEEMEDQNPGFEVDDGIIPNLSSIANLYSLSGREDLRIVPIDVPTFQKRFRMVKKKKFKEKKEKEHKLCERIGWRKCYDGIFPGIEVSRYHHSVLADNESIGTSDPDS